MITKCVQQIRNYFKGAGCFLLAGIFCALFLSITQSHAAEESKGFPISLNSMILFALDENPDIEIFRERRNQASFAIKEKQADYYPEISFRAEAGRAYNSPGAGVTVSGSSALGNSGEAAVSLEQLVFDGFRTINEVKNRKELLNAADYRTDAAVEEIINETVENYLKALRFQKDIQMGEKLLTNINKTVKTIEELFEAGATGKVMLDYARSRLAFATTELNRHQSSLNDAISNLEFLAGKLPDDFVAIAAEELDPHKIDLQYYLDLIEQDNSQVMASAKEVEAMEHTLAVEKGKYFPTVTFNALAEQTHNSGGPSGREREVSAMFRVNYEIFDGFKKRAATNRIRSQIRELDQKKLQILKDLRRDVKLAYNQVEANQSALKLTEIEIESNIAQERLNQENFKLGEINVIELIESAERLKDAYLKKNELTYQLHFSAYRLLVLTGIIERDYFCEACE